jgi:hypothetical protein
MFIAYWKTGKWASTKKMGHISILDWAEKEKLFADLRTIYIYKLRGTR